MKNRIANLLPLDGRPYRAPTGPNGIDALEESIRLTYSEDFGAVLSRYSADIEAAEQRGLVRGQLTGEAVGTQKGITIGFDAGYTAGQRAARANLDAGSAGTAVQSDWSLWGVLAGTAALWGGAVWLVGRVVGWW